MERSAIVPGPEGLKALSHPGRLRMLGLLRSEGPATATTLATRLGLNSGATSYHLRQLEKHGFVVEDTTRGNARDRWWRATHQYTRTDVADATTPEEHDTYEAYIQAVAMIYGEQLQRAVEEMRLLPRALAGRRQPQRLDAAAHPGPGQGPGRGAARGRRDLARGRGRPGRRAVQGQRQRVPASRLGGAAGGGGPS